MNFVLIPSEAGMRQHKLTKIVVIKILYQPIPGFLVAPFDFITFFTLAILNRATPFFTARLFLSRSMFWASRLIISIKIVTTFAKKLQVQSITLQKLGRTKTHNQKMCSCMLHSNAHKIELSAVLYRVNMCSVLHFVS